MGSLIAMSSIKLSAEAHAVVLLHAFKFPHGAVCGVLVGSADDSKIVVKHAVALAHGVVSLSPMFEVALTQVEHKYAGDGLKVIGYYQANVHLQDNGSIGDLGRKMGDSIRAHSELDTACLLLVDNEEIAKLGASCTAIKPWSWDSKKRDWKLNGGEVLEVPDGSSEAVVAAFRADHHRKLVDFDDHLEDVAQDWFNEGLLANLA